MLDDYTKKCSNISSVSEKRVEKKSSVKSEEGNDDFRTSKNVSPLVIACQLEPIGAGTGIGKFFLGQQVGITTDLAFYFALKPSFLKRARDL